MLVEGGSLSGTANTVQILPWDSDIDVQMTVDTMRFIATYYNMTVHHFRLPDIAEGRDYMLEVNPAYVNGDPKDWLNMIDARWIDTETGLFIDITSIRVNETARALGIEGALMCKDKHHYLVHSWTWLPLIRHKTDTNLTQEKDLFPLRESVFEGTPVKIPYDYTWLLEEEYKKESLTRTTFEKLITAMPTEETAIADSVIKTPLQRRDYGVGAYQVSSVVFYCFLSTRVDPFPLRKGCAVMISTLTALLPVREQRRPKGSNRRRPQR